MKLIKKSELFKLASPLGEPNLRYYDSEYYIERIEYEDKKIVWFGIETNWVKEWNKSWTYLTVDENVLPNKEGIYPAERLIFKQCEEPIYEMMRNNEGEDKGENI